MRISNVVRFVEDTAIVAASKVAEKSRSFYRGVNREYMARRLLMMEREMLKRERLNDMRRVVEAMEKLHEAHATGSFEDELNKFRAEHAQAGE